MIHPEKEGRQVTCLHKTLNSRITSSEYLMKNILSIGFLTALAISVYADSPADNNSSTGQADDDVSCRKIIVRGEEEGVYCGNEQQWAEFDRRVASMNRQRNDQERRQRDINQAMNMGAEQSANAAALGNTSNIPETVNYYNPANMEPGN